MNPKFAAIKHSADLKSVHGISVFYSEKVFFNRNFRFDSLASSVCSSIQRRNTGVEAILPFSLELADERTQFHHFWAGRSPAPAI
jgi:hypothetical protein